LIEVLAQVVGVAGVPLKVTVLVPWVVPKLVPLIVTEVPTTAELGVTLVMPGSTVKLTPALATPLTLTTTLPVVAPFGTGTCIEVLLHAVGVAAVLLNTTVLVPCVAPKFVPPIVTTVPTGPALGVRPVMVGVGKTVKLTPLLDSPFTVTTTLPVVAPAGTGTLIEALAQVVGVPGVPLKVTVLVPWDVPKLVPAIVTDTPTAAELGVRVVIVGVAAAETPTQTMTSMRVSRVSRMVRKEERVEPGSASWFVDFSNPADIPIIIAPSPGLIQDQKRPMVPVAAHNTDSAIRHRVSRGNQTWRGSGDSVIEITTGTLTSPSPGASWLTELDEPYTRRLWMSIAEKCPLRAQTCARFCCHIYFPHTQG
jgi:hypothetical protein